MTCLQRSLVTFGHVIFDLLSDCTGIVLTISEHETEPKLLSYVLGSISKVPSLEWTIDKQINFKEQKIQQEKFRNNDTKQDKRTQSRYRTTILKIEQGCR